MLAILLTAAIAWSAGFTAGAWWFARPSSEQRRSRILPIDADVPVRRDTRTLEVSHYG